MPLPDPRRRPTYPRPTPRKACYICKRTGMVEAGCYVRVDFRGDVGIRNICDICLERAEELARA